MSSPKPISGLKSNDNNNGISKLYSIPTSPAANIKVSDISFPPGFSKLKEPKPPPKPAYQLKPPSKPQTHWYKPASLKPS